MTQLDDLRGEIAALRRKRQSVRSATAYTGLATAVLWTLGAGFAVDFLVEGGAAFRAAMLLAVAAAVVWGAQRWAWPWLKNRESDLDVALLIEDQHSAAQGPLGRDLVAALQFDTPAAADWGSTALEQAVVEQVAEQAAEIDLTFGLRTDVLARRAAALFVSALIGAVAIALYPNHAAAFFNRLLLGRMHYPTATVIEKIVINGQEIPPAIGREAANVACAEGQPVTIEVFARGELPAAGRVEMRIAGERRLTVRLPSAANADQLADRKWTAYVGRVERLDDDATYQVFLGDAWTDPARIELVPLPVIDSQLVVTPPEYARAVLAGQRHAPSPGSRSLEVLEGSRVAIEVTCHNKPLASAAVTIGEKEYPLAKLDDDGRRWWFDPSGTPLERVTEAAAYKITAVDVDGLAPHRSVEGALRIKIDRPPRISASAKTRHVLPTGRPTIEYRATDDYAVARVVAKAMVVRQGPADVKRFAREPIVVAAGTPTLAEADDDGTGSASGGRRRDFAVPLASLGVKKGDRLELVLEAVDYRGSTPGKSAAADPLVFHITDVAGVESAVTEIDPVVEQQLQSLIEEQLGIGGSK